jgi:ribosome-binding factor A
VSTRQEKVEEQLKIEISDIVRRELKDPRVGFLTITDVEITPDLRHARVFFSVLGDDQAREGTLKALRSASKFIRGEVGKRVRMRYIPELDFRVDASIEQGARIFELLQKINKDEPDKE